MAIDMPDGHTPGMSEFLRQPRHAYEDPLARIWQLCAERVGFRVIRSREAYASADGCGNLLIATEDQFDPDDNLGQMIFHELCHALVEGDRGEGLPDWGLDNARTGHPWREHACLRLQAWLADRHGLRDFLAPTTDFRVSFWDSLPADPFAVPPEQGGRRERSCVAARIGAWRASLPRWAAPLREALQATAGIAALVAGHGGPTAGQPASLVPLWDTATTPPTPHPAGHAAIAAYHAGATCGDCAWHDRRRHSLGCRHVPRARLRGNPPACDRYEPAAELDCQTCGACCREAYQAVEVSSRDPVNRRHPELVQVEATRRRLRRAGDRCAALTGGQQPGEGFACTIYPDRPQTCRDFTRGSANCLDARRRVGLSL